MEKKIAHEGIVESIDGSHIRVKILQTSACSSCEAKTLCCSAESTEKLIDIYNSSSSDHQVGDKVVVCGSKSMSRNAVIIAFTIPLLLIILCVVCGNYLFPMSEQQIMVSILVMLSIYYLFIRIFRNRLMNRFTFWIERVKDQ